MLIITISQWTCDHSFTIPEIRPLVLWLAEIKNMQSSDDRCETNEIKQAKLVSWNTYFSKRFL